MIDWLLVLLTTFARADAGCVVLDALDERRTVALEHDDPAALADVYVPGSPLRTSDERLLAAYRERGLRLRGAGVETLGCRTTVERPGRLVVDVVDRVTATSVAGTDGERALPRDRPSRHVVELRRTADGWRVAAVRDR
jgi:hypothetical protein